MRKTLIALMPLGLALAACSQPAADNAANSMENGAEDFGNAMDETGMMIENGAADAGNAIANTADDVGEAASNVGSAIDNEIE